MPNCMAMSRTGKDVGAIAPADQALWAQGQRDDRRLAEIRDCSDLYNNLAPAYFRSGNNGMPWGVWDPQYQPVGIVKVKSA